jgi:hypothetical protein
VQVLEIPGLLCHHQHINKLLDIFLFRWIDIRNMWVKERKWGDKHFLNNILAYAFFDDSRARQCLDSTLDLADDANGRFGQVT